jgi:hypothetical protein
VAAAQQVAAEALLQAGGSFEELCCNVKDALVDMAFEHGAAAFGSPSKFLARVAQHYWVAAAAEGSTYAACDADGGRCNENMARVRQGCGLQDTWLSPPSWASARSNFEVRSALYLGVDAARTASTPGSEAESLSLEVALRLPGNLSCASVVHEVSIDLMQTDVPMFFYRQGTSGLPVGAPTQAALALTVDVNGLLTAPRMASRWWSGIEPAVLRADLVQVVRHDAAIICGMLGNYSSDEALTLYAQQLLLDLGG